MNKRPADGFPEDAPDPKKAREDDVVMLQKQIHARNALNLEIFERLKLHLGYDKIQAVTRQIKRVCVLFDKEECKTRVRIQLDRRLRSMPYPNDVAEDFGLFFAPHLHYFDVGEMIKTLLEETRPEMHAQKLQQWLKYVNEMHVRLGDKEQKISHELEMLPKCLALLGFENDGILCVERFIYPRFNYKIDADMQSPSIAEATALLTLVMQWYSITPEGAAH
jgi:hypothetical protein